MVTSGDIKNKIKINTNMKEIEKEYYEFCKLFDDILTEDDNDDFFTGNISKSSRTETNKDEKQK